MSDLAAELEPLFARFVEEHVLHGRVLRAADLCGPRVDLVAPLHQLIDRYQSITMALDGGLTAPDDRQAGAAPAEALPQFDGFQTIERLGAGGMGEVFKLRDLTLDRIVAGKVIRRDRPRRRASASSCARRARWRSSPTAASSASSSSGPTPIRPSSSWSTSTGSSSGRIGPSLEFAPARPRAHRHLRRARARARARPAAPRPEAVEHHGRRPARAADSRLRPQLRPSLSRPSQGHAALRRARTARSVAADRSAHRRLRARRGPLRAALRPSAVRRRDRRGSDCGDPRRPAAAAGRDRSAGPGTAAGDRAQGDGARPGAALQLGARPRRRPAALSRRADRCWRGRRCTPRRSACGSRRTCSRSASGSACG